MRRVISAFTASAVFVSISAQAAPPVVNPTDVACAPPGGNLKISAQVTSSSPISSARVYFHEAGYTLDHFVEMHQGPEGTFWAMLPVPLADSKFIVYRIAVKDADGKETVADTQKVPIVEPCSVPQTEEEKKFASNIIVGLTVPDQSPVPPGFECPGIVSQISPSGELKPVAPCDKAAGGAVVPIPLGVAGVPLPVWLVGAAALGAGTGFLVCSKDCNPISVSRP